MEEVRKNNKIPDSTGSTEYTSSSSINKADKIPSSAWRTLAILSSIATLVMYTETMLVPSLPNIISEFDLSYSISPWILTTYLIVGAVMTPVTSRLAEIYGKRKILLVVLGVYAVGVTVGALTTDFYSFVIARGLQGVGISMFPIAFSVIREQFPKSRLAIGQGVITSMFASGSILGLVVGATIAEYSGWRMTFLSILPIAILLPIVVWKFARIGVVHSDWMTTTTRSTQQGTEPTDNRKPLDVFGAVTLAATITLFLLSLTFIETSTAGSNNTQSILQLAILSAGCVAAFVAFLFAERRTNHPLIDLKLLRNKILLFTNIMMIILGFSMFMVFQTIPILAESPPPIGFGESITGAAANSAAFLDNFANLWSNIWIHSIKTRLNSACYNRVCYKRIWIFHACNVPLSTMDGICCPRYYFNWIIAWQCWIDEYSAPCHPIQKYGHFNWNDVIIENNW